MMCAYALRRKSSCAGSSGSRFLGQVEAELPKLGALVGEKAVKRVVEHCRYQISHDRTPWPQAAVLCESPPAWPKTSLGLSLGLRPQLDQLTVWDSRESELDPADIDSGKH